MVSVLLNFWLSFLAGLFAPLGAVCVLPLYPGFLAYLAGKVGAIEESEQKKKIIMFGVIVSFGIILSMFIVGLLFSAIFSSSLTNAIGIISPIAFGLLVVVSLMLIFDFDFTRFMPKTHSPVLKNPYLSSLVFGLFFGAVVLPCNPASLAVLFAVSSSVTSFFTNLLNFVFFGIGMSLPLIILAVVSGTYSKQVIGFLTRNRRRINLIAGIIMLVVALYYLIFVFDLLNKLLEFLL
jgi:cytochrome c-type biogenesis protein